MDVNNVGSIELDNSVYLNPTITIYDLRGKLIKKFTPTEDKAWDLYCEIVSAWEKEKSKNENV